MRPIQQEAPVPPFEKVTDVITVIFEVTDAETRWGESLRVVGDCAELGCWAPEDAIRLTTSPEDFPLWRSAEVKFRILRQDAKCCGSEVVVDYKYIRDASKLGQGFRWEERIADRKVHLVPVQGGIWKVKDPAFNVMGAPTLTPVFGPTKATCNAGDDDAPRPAPAAAPPCRTAQSEARNHAARRATPECTPEPEAQDTPKFADAYCVIGSEALGTGGFSSVWRCRSKAGCEEYAVKRIETGKLTKRGWRFLFGHRGAVGEIQIHGSVHHPNVVALREVFQEVGTVSIVMECCHGGDLLEIVHGHSRRCGRGLPEVAAGSAVRQLLRALSYLHDLQILHRDVKCENIFHKELLGALPLEAATFKLGDFGLAARIAPDEVLLEPVGSPSTSAPEVVCGRPYAKPADIWSAGVAAFIALAAHRPFEASTSRQLVERATRGQVSLQGSPWEDLSPHACSFVKDLLRPQATHRPSVEVALAHSWLQR